MVCSNLRVPKLLAFMNDQPCFGSPWCASITAVRSALLAVAMITSGATSRSLRAQKADPYLARAEAVLRSTPLVDGRNDLPWRVRGLRCTQRPRGVRPPQAHTGHDGPRSANRAWWARNSGQSTSRRKTHPTTSRTGRSRALHGYARVSSSRSADASHHRKYRIASLRRRSRRAQGVREQKIGSLTGMEGGHASRTRSRCCASTTSAARDT